jgi:hypothetical protein
VGFCRRKGGREEGWREEGKKEGKVAKKVQIIS